MKKRKMILLLLCVLVFGSFGFTACGNGAEAPAPNDSDQPKEETYPVTLYFANEEYIATGDESMEKYFAFEAKVTSAPDSVYKDTLKMLRTTPGEGYSTVINDQIKFNDVYAEGDTIFVDLAGGGLSGGSLQETFLIGQIVNTLLNSFDEISQVQFLVDGKIVETLMGHMGTADPFTKEMVAE